MFNYNLIIAFTSDKSIKKIRRIFFHPGPLTLYRLSLSMNFKDTIVRKINAAANPAR